MEKTLVILKPCTVQRGLIGEIVTRFEKKGLRLAGMKMVWLTDEILPAGLRPAPGLQAVPAGLRHPDHRRERHRKVLPRPGHPSGPAPPRPLRHGGLRHHLPHPV